VTNAGAPRAVSMVCQRTVMWTCCLVSSFLCLCLSAGSLATSAVVAQQQRQPAPVPKNCVSPSSLSLSLSSPPPPVVVVRVHHWSVTLLFLSVMRLFPLFQQVGGGGEKGREREKKKESGTIHHQILGSVSRLRTLTGLFS